jgi:hypothetical protein
MARLGLRHCQGSLNAPFLIPRTPAQAVVRSHKRIVRDTGLPPSREYAARQYER